MPGPTRHLAISRTMPFGKRSLSTSELASTISYSWAPHVKRIPERGPVRSVPGPFGLQSTSMGFPRGRL
eukprot:14611115-Alexandrium_andersonii.AAC.1